MFIWVARKGTDMKVSMLYFPVAFLSFSLVNMSISPPVETHLISALDAEYQDGIKLCTSGA